MSNVTLGSGFRPLSLGEHCHASDVGETILEEAIC